jgi:hypothetical protein
MRSLSILIPIAGILLLMVLAIPLVKFYEDIDGLNIQTTSTSTKIIVSVSYNVSVPLTDYSLKVYNGTTLLNETSGEKLTSGDKLILTIDRTQLSNMDDLVLEFSGKINGLYFIEIRVHK